MYTSHLLLFFLIGPVIQPLLIAKLWPITNVVAADKDHTSVRGAKWWILHRHRLNQLHNIPAPEFEKWFTNRQWRQFMSVLPGSRRTRTINQQLFEAAIVGVKRALHECQRQFRHERWNCSLLADNQAGSIFGRLLLRGTPETAFVHAIVSAGIVQSIAEACLRIHYCPCNNRGRRNPKGRWQWQGCDHNVWFGKRFSRRMLDALEEGWHIRFRMNAHNNEAGRRNVVRHLQLSCRCHGTSGSCAMKTCFRKTPSMRVIGNVLKDRYKRAVKVTQDNNIHTFDGKTESQALASSASATGDNGMVWRPQRRSNRRRSRNQYPSNTWRKRNNREQEADQQGQKKKNKKRRKKTFLLRADPYYKGKPPARTSLVFYEEVPEDFYCLARPEWNVLGTTGRVCNSTSSQSNNCLSLCCSRGYLTRHYRATVQCECKFVWCCTVQCKTCNVTKRRETCADKLA